MRDHITKLELVLNMLAEATTAEISKEKKPINFKKNQRIAKQGEAIAGNTRKKLKRKQERK